MKIITSRIVMKSKVHSKLYIEHSHASGGNEDTETNSVGVYIMYLTAARGQQLTRILDLEVLFSPKKL